MALLSVAWPMCAAVGHRSAWLQQVGLREAGRALAFATDPKVYPLLAPGSQVVVRDEEWVIRAVGATEVMGRKISVVGTSELVWDQQATFFTALDKVDPLDPNATKLVADESPNFRSSRLYLESLLRRTPVPLSEPRLTVGPLQLLDSLEYQRQPVAKALQALQPRILIADAVGLGKTLEVGMLLTELIRRGRGERILVVTPKHILEQFQLEMWSRFSLPLVRLDSEGIQRVRQKIPATRNPFSFFKRVIISIDTLKADRYGHHLESVQWDAVVIDECHNLVNRSSDRNRLARTLAPNTDALILTSATPHNGKSESFAELINLLDPTAIADPTNYSATDIEHLYVRRHKNSPAVEHEVGTDWANRRPLEGIQVPATSQEEVVFNELNDVWLHPPAGQSPVSGQAQRLFPYTLLKAFLSSHKALAETITNRRAKVEKAVNDARRETEVAALDRLAELNDKITDANAAKLDALVKQLTAIGVSAKSDTRVVIFSERHATLEWLAEALPAKLKLKPKNINVLHGSMLDTAQMQVVEDFALERRDVRVLLTGDIASEGVNLHRQCHNLVHFDLPWSLITIEQRNGRIDRYGQKHAAEIRALILRSATLESGGEMAVLNRLLAKATEAHRAYGDASPLMGLYDEAAEAKAIEQAMADGTPIIEVIPDEPMSAFDLLMATAGDVVVEEGTEVIKLPSLFASDAEYFADAITEVYPDAERELDFRMEQKSSLVSFRPPADLIRRLDVLPQNYLKARKVLDRLKLTSDPAYANASLARARDEDELLWPEEVFFTGQHPVMDWVSDKLLQHVGRNEAPAMRGKVDNPTFVVQGMYSNKSGQATVAEWMAIDHLATEPRVRSLADLLDAAAIGAKMANPGGLANSAALTEAQEAIPLAINIGRDYLKRMRQERSKRMLESVKQHERRLNHWREESSSLAEQLALVPIKQKRVKQIDATVEAQRKLIARLSSDGEPLVRVVAVLLP
jgi:ERCC4-related helicase